MWALNEIMSLFRLNGLRESSRGAPREPFGHNGAVILTHVGSGLSFTGSLCKKSFRLHALFFTFEPLY